MSPAAPPVNASATSLPGGALAAGAEARPAEAGTRPGARDARPAVPADGIQNYGPATAPDPYPVECKQTAAAVAARLAPAGLTEADWFFAFQSQGIAGAPWLGPTVPDTLRALADSGCKGVVMQPIGFLCDHVEILYDIDIDFAAQARELGLELWRAESLNDSPTLIRAIQHVLATRSKPLDRSADAPPPESASSTAAPFQVRVTSENPLPLA